MSKRNQYISRCCACIPFTRRYNNGLLKGRGGGAYDSSPQLVLRKTGLNETGFPTSNPVLCPHEWTDTGLETLFEVRIQSNQSRWLFYMNPWSILRVKRRWPYSAARPALISFRRAPAHDHSAFYLEYPVMDALCSRMNPFGFTLILA